MTAQLVLPLSSKNTCGINTKANEDLVALVSEWFDRRTAMIREIWSCSESKLEKRFPHSSSTIANKIAAILTHRTFNFQSKMNANSIIDEVRQNLALQINSGTAIKFFFLLNGGYRASPLLDCRALIFEPDQTELMLLYQISLLSKKISDVYNYGIEFFIVINNGVAKWVNDIPIATTEDYAAQLRELIEFLGAHDSVKVLVQSELDEFDPLFSFGEIPQQPLISESEHFVVERFLGRSCSEKEAEYRSTLYKLAESKWAEHLLPIVTSNHGLVMRQVAHPDMLSFRPFPGGAIRTQNGTFGFQYQENSLRPKLITSKSVREHDFKWVPYDFPWVETTDHVTAFGLRNA